MGSLGTEISWPSEKPQERQSRIHNHHISLRDRIKELQSRTHEKHPEAEQVHGNQETAKAVAWAVFQHHGEGGVGHGHRHGMAVRRPTRFKLEAQMKLEVAHQSVYEAVAFSWDAGSTLFDSFELNSLLKTLDQAAHAHPAGLTLQENHRDDDADESGAMVVYSPKHCVIHPQPQTPPQRHRQWTLTNSGRRVEDCRLDTLDEMGPSKAHGEDQGQRGERYNPSADAKLNNLHKHDHDDGNDVSSASVFGHWYTPKTIGRRSFDSSTLEKPAKGGAHHHHHHHHHHHSRWKNLLHTLHLDGANGIFHGFHKSHTQVAPHDLEKNLEYKGRSGKLNHKGGSHGRAHLDCEQYDGHFDRHDLPVAKDGHPPSDKDTDDHHHGHHHRHHPHFWKFGFKTVLTQPFCRPGHLLSDDEESDPEESHKGHKKHHGYKHADLRAAWSSLTAKLHHHHHHHEHEHENEHEHGRQRNDHQGSEQSVIEHHYHHHHHHHHVAQPEGEDNEMTVQDISMRVARNSFEEKASRLSIEDGGLKAPRNSLETEGERARA